jgi:hypothetical protein
MKFKQTDESPKTPLCELFYKYGSDKCPQIYHSYSEYYYEILKDNKEKIKEVIEIGIGTKELMTPIVGSKYQIGASLKAWRDFFPNAKIYGLDINKNSFFEEERISCFYTDQSNSNSLEQTISEIKKLNNNNDFDLIIDDGSHIVSHMLLSFKTLFKFLKKDGIYIIEDIKKHEMKIFENIDIIGGEIIFKFDGNSEWYGFIAIKKY